MVLTQDTLTAFSQGDIAPLYNKVYPSLLAFSYRCLGSDYGFLAEDAVQDAIYHAYQKRDSFSSPFHLKSFLYTAIHNKCVSTLRKHNSRERYVSQQSTSTDDLLGRIIEQETLDLLYTAISSLPNDLKTIFDLSFEQGLKNAEIACVIGMSESSVKKKKARLIQLLRTQLGGNEAMAVLFLVATL